MPRCSAICGHGEQCSFNTDHVFCGKHENLKSRSGDVRLSAQIPANIGLAPDSAKSPPKSPPKPDTDPKAPPFSAQRKQGAQTGSRPPEKCTPYLKHEPNEWCTRLNDMIRDKVYKHSDELNQRQRGNGAYTLRPLPKYEDVKPQVDHIFECQAMGHVLFKVEALRPVLNQVNSASPPASS
jgi:hypothetical protein